MNIHPAIVNGQTYSLHTFGPYSGDNGQEWDVEIYHEDVYLGTYTVPEGKPIADNLDTILDSLPQPEDREFEPLFD